MKYRPHTAFRTHPVMWKLGSELNYVADIPQTWHRGANSAMLLRSQEQNAITKD